MSENLDKLIISRKLIKNLVNIPAGIIIIAAYRKPSSLFLKQFAPPALVAQTSDSFRSGSIIAILLLILCCFNYISELPNLNHHCLIFPDTQNNTVDRLPNSDW